MTAPVVIVPAHPAGPNLMRTAAALMTSTVASSALGLVFWVVAAHMFPAAAVGRASAVVSSMTLLAGLAQLNLVSMYARFLPGAGTRTLRIVLGGYAASALMALLLAGGFLILGAGGPVLAGSQIRWWFTVGVLASGIFFIQDGVLTALGQAGRVPVKNVVAAAAKLALLPLFAAAVDADGLLVAWVLPVAAVMLVTNGWILARLIPAHARGHTAESTDGRGQLISFASAEYVNGLLNNAVAFLPPLLVVRELGDIDAAYFYAPWVIGVAVSTLLWNVVTSFVVAAATTKAATRHQAVRLVRLVGLVVGTAVVLLTATAGPLLSVMGAQYADAGAPTLRLVALSLPFTGVILLYAAFAMVDKRMWRLVAAQLVGAAVFLAGTLWGLPELGLRAPAAALVVAQGAVALALLPTLIRRFRATGTSAQPIGTGAMTC